MRDAFGGGNKTVAETETFKYWRGNFSLNTRLCNALTYQGIKTVEELREIPYEWFTRMPNLGPTSIGILYSKISGLRPQPPSQSPLESRVCLERRLERLLDRLALRFMEDRNFRSAVLKAMERAAQAE